MRSKSMTSSNFVAISKLDGARTWRGYFISAGTLFLLVTTRKNTILKVNGSNHSPSFLGPIMICMTKEEHTYLSSMHSLLREVPGFSHYLHAYGTDNEAALVGAPAAAFQNAHGLLCYIYIKKNISVRKLYDQRLGEFSAKWNRQAYYFPFKTWFSNFKLRKNWPRLDY